ncbi:DUF4062 domain-containing protein [Aneurinibacillus tyrosinisolvens]|uniref:DUF4062 domain-containing protein n=1 Tax=Aneurinibacillus tyrosinisolvens TaxID=1443435 RepID=UPI00063FD26B|nr:DUF4062 domain-containing protein [Aneurinibacillus tyrosinisolvens]
MADPTKIFISSVAQDTLTRIRSDVFRTFSELGHQPEMYEETFGPWTSDADGVTHCIRKVNDCHMFLLFVHNKGGTYLENAGKTVTHLEFIEAHAKQKLILVFIEDSVKKRYFQDVKWIILEFIGNYTREHGRKPHQRSIFEMLKGQAGNNNSGIPSPSEVDPYVWVFLYDIIEEKGLYAESLYLGVIVDWKQYASDIMRRGAILIPHSEQLKKSAELASSYGEFSDLAFNLLGKIEIKSIPDWSRFLASLRNRIIGGEIHEEFGGFTSVPLGEIKNCSAIAVFKRSGNLLELVSSEGDTTPDSFYELGDESSFVSLTYQQDSDNEQLYFRDTKRMFYLTFRVNEYVISYHFPAVSDWNQEKYNDFHEDITNGIINTHANVLIFDFMKLILGGLQDEQA